MLLLRADGGVLVASITNNANNPAVGCVLRAVPVAGPATMLPPPDVNFTVTGTDEARIPPQPPAIATGSTFHVTVTCDNGLSASLDAIY